MLDQSEKGSASEDQSKKYPEWIQPKGAQNQNIRIETMKNCADCGTFKTPLWRGGPAGPKSLCNACGIRSRKKRGAILGLNKGEDKKSRRGNNNNNNKSSSSSNTPKNLGDNLKKRLLSLGRQVLMQRSKVEENQRRKLGEEEEQAALLLMALSYGSVYA